MGNRNSDIIKEPNIKEYDYIIKNEKTNVNKILNEIIPNALKEKGKEKEKEKENEMINKQFKEILPFIRVYDRIRSKKWEIKLTDYDNSIAAFIFHLARIDICYLETIIIKEDEMKIDKKEKQIKNIMLCFILILLKYGPQTVIFKDQQSADFVESQAIILFQRDTGINIQLIHLIEKTCSDGCNRSILDWTIIRENDGYLTFSVHNKKEQTLVNEEEDDKDKINQKLQERLYSLLNFGNISDDYILND